MNQFYEFDFTPFDDSDPRETAARFEEHLATNNSLYLDPSTIEEVFEYYRVTQDLDKAYRLIQFALDRFPYRAEFFYRKSCLDLDAGNTTLALIEIERALQLSPVEFSFLLQKARVHLAQKNSAAVADTLHTALDLANDDPNAYYHIGILYQHADRHVLAICYLKQALAGNPEFEDPLYEILYCYEAEGKTTEALAFITAYLDQRPYSAVAWYNLGVLYQKQGLFENALQAFDYAAVIDEYFLSAYYGKGLCLMQLQRFDAAIRAFLDALRQDATDAASLMSLAECYEELGKTSRARFYYCKVANYFEDLPEAHIGIGATLEAEERWYEAVHHYQKALEMAADHVDALLGIAECDYQVGNLHSAFTHLERALQLVPEDVDLVAEWADRLVEADLLGKALDLLERGMNHNPTAYPLMYQFVAFAFRAGRRTDGLVVLENALMLDYTGHRHFIQRYPEAQQLAPIQSLLEQYKPQTQRA